MSLSTSFCHKMYLIWGFPGGTSGKEPICQYRTQKRWGLNPWVRKIPWRRAWQPTPVFLPGGSHELGSLAVGWQSTGWQRVRNNRSDLAHMQAHPLFDMKITVSFILHWYSIFFYYFTFNLSGSYNYDIASILTLLFSWIIIK